MTQRGFKSLTALLQRLPSFVWIILVVLLIAGLIGAVIGACYVISNYEGAATLLMIAAGWIVIRMGASLSSAVTTPAASGGEKIVVGLAIAFYAAMGIAVDQPGNYLFNLPVQWIYCPAHTELQRGVDISHPLPGRTDIRQDFTCVTPTDHQFVKQIGDFPLIWIRFVEYVLVGYILLALNRLYTVIRHPAATQAA